MILNLQNQSQLLDDWCWAAVTSSISFNYDAASQWTQGELAGSLLDSSCSNINKSNAGSAPTVCNQQYDLQKALTCSNNYAWVVEGNLTFNQISNQINSGWPICCQIYWDVYDQSHFIIIFGYNGSTIVIGDPDAGVCSIDYNDLINGYRAGKWIRTFGTQPAQ